jgi:hypothetical protein
MFYEEDGTNMVVDDETNLNITLGIGPEPTTKQQIKRRRGVQKTLHTIELSPSLVMHDNIKLYNSGQTMRILVPNIPSVEFTNATRHELRQGNVLLKSVAHDSIQLALNAARQIFAQFFIVALQQEIITRAKVID